MEDINSLCFGCFREIGSAAVCPYCGYRTGFPQHSGVCLAAGTILNGKYLIGKTLGQGGFGVTYLALELINGRKVAIKEYLPDGMATRSSSETRISVYSRENADSFQYGMNKFLEEAKILARFSNHPNIVSVYSFFMENGTAYYVMEYIEGMTLKEYLAEHGGRIPFEEAFSLLAPVMDALSVIHREGLLHRDVSPDNIYVTRDGSIRLLDFGAARYNLGEQSKSLSVILKPGFAPEEQYRTHGRQGPWTDVYALGATFYLLLTGDVPPNSLDRLSHDEILPLSQAGISYPPGADTVLMKALALRADYRWQSVEEFSTALRNPMQTVSSARPNPDEVKRERYAPPQRANTLQAKPRKPKAIAVVAIIVIPLILLILIILAIAGLAQEAEDESNYAAVNRTYGNVCMKMKLQGGKSGELCELRQAAVSVYD